MTAERGETRATNPLSGVPAQDRGRRGMRWQTDELVQLLDEITAGHNITHLMRTHQRTRSAIMAAAMRLLPPEMRPETPAQAVIVLSHFLKDRQDHDRELLAAQYFVEKSSGAPRAPRVWRAALLDLPPAPEETLPVVVLADAFALVSEAVNEVREDRVRKVLQLRLGGGGHPQTLAEIGEMMGVSRERVRQLQTRALAYLAYRARRAGSPGSTLRSLFADIETNSDLLVERLLEVTAYFDTSPSVAFLFVLGASGYSHQQAITISEAATASMRARIETERIKDAEQARLHREIKAVVHLEARVSKWLREADWGETTRPPLSPEHLFAQRNVNPESAGDFWSRKLARRVRYESSVELEVLHVLEQSEQVSYYQEQPFAIPYTFGGRARHYFPDIFAATTDGRGLLIEVKPIPNMALSINRVKADAGRSWANQRGWGWITLDAHKTIADLFMHEVKTEARSHLDRELLSAGRLTWRDMLGARERYELSSFDITAYVLQSGARLTLEPRYEVTPRRA